MMHYLEGLLLASRYCFLLMLGGYRSGRSRERLAENECYMRVADDLEKGWDEMNNEKK